MTAISTARNRISAWIDAGAPGEEPAQAVPSSLSIAVVRIAFFWFTGAASACAVFTLTSQIAGISFRTLSFLCLFAAILHGVFTFYFARRELRRVNGRDRGVLICLACLGILGSTIALVSHRPDTDDTAYLSGARYSLEHPLAPMDFDIHFVAGTGFGLFEMFPYSLSHPHDFGRAAIAYLFHLDIVNVFYLYSVALGGFMIAMATFYLLTHFAADTRAALVGTAFAIFVVLLMGEAHRSYGNFSFNRIFQGKAIALSVGVPLFAAATFSFFRDRSLYSWLLVFFTATAAVGATTSAIPVIGALAVSVTAASFAASLHRRRDLFTAAAAFASLGLITVYALFLKLNLGSRLSSNDPTNAEFPKTFWGHLGWMSDLDKPATYIVLGISVVLAVFLSGGRKRLLFTAWVTAAIVFFLNPLVGPFMINHVTSPNIYWRVFYILPAPAFAGIAAALVYGRTKRFGKLAHTGFWSLAFLALLALHIPKSSSSVFRTGTRIGKPQPKVYPVDHHFARKVLETNPPPGVMLAPERISIAIPMLDSAYPQVRYMDWLLLSQKSYGHDSEEIDLRLLASDFVTGDGSKFPAFKEFIERFPPRSIVMANESATNKDVQALLGARGFSNYRAIPGFVVFWRTAAPSGLPAR